MKTYQSYPSYQSRGLTPERLAAIFEEADAGDPARQAELFEEMEEKDAHLYSVLQTRKLALAGLDWEVSPAPGSEGDIRAAMFVREAITLIDNWDEALLDLLDAIGKGFAVSEIMWEVAGGKALIKELRRRPQSGFKFIQGDASPRLATEDPQGVPLRPDKFVVHKYMATGGLPSRGGVLRPCAYMYLFKNYAVKDWLIFGERYAMPMRVGKFRPQATDAEKRVLRNAVFNLGSDAAAVISDSTVIELVESAAKAPSAAIYERLVSFADSAMSKAVLGQTLTVEQAGGTYATAKVHQTVRKDILEADSKALAKTIERQIIRPLAIFNFGPNVPVPVFKFHHEEAEDLRALAETYATLARAGLGRIPESFIRRKFGIPEAKDQ